MSPGAPIGSMIQAAPVGPSANGSVAGVGQPGISISPGELIAPVHSEVVLLAGISGLESNLVANQPLEWVLSPESVGRFVTVSASNGLSLFGSPSSAPRTVNDRFATGMTSQGAQIVTRGTPTASDDFSIQRGQAWITMSSATEGTSHVTVQAPQLAGLSRASARIHWIDAQWLFPPAAVKRAGSRHILTTSVTRRTDGLPIVGWNVRYRITDGALARFAPNGVGAVDVKTDAAGQANVEIYPLEGRSGSSQIQVQVIRPPLPSQSEARPLILGSAVTSVTWSASDVALRTTGPSQASPGGNVTYRIEVTNPGTLPSPDTVVTVEVPGGLTYLESRPQARVTGTRLEWRLDEILAGQTSTIQVDFRLGATGTVDLCARAQSQGGIISQDCVSTMVGAATLDLQVTGPREVQVGANARFEVVVTNRGNLPATGLVITDEFDEGLRHIKAESLIERELGELPPGRSTKIPLNFRVTKSGSLCHTVDVKGDGGLRATQRVCVTATQPAPDKQAAIRVEKTGPRQQRVGETAKFTVYIRNTGDVPLTNLHIADSYEAALRPTDASEGYRIENDELVWTIDRLDPGKTERLDVHCECLQAIEHTCNRVVVDCDQRPPAVHEWCLEIVPAEEPATQPEPPVTNGPEADGVDADGALKVTIADLADGVRVGDLVKYQIVVKNPGKTSDYNVVLSITFPDELTPEGVGTLAPTEQYKIDGNSVRFDAVAEIRAGEKLSYLIPFEAQQAGSIRLVAELSSRGLQQAIRVEETTEILAQ